jgi:Zn-dependent membrane protease YugP
MFLFDPTFILLIPVLLFAGWAQMRVSTTFNEYSRVAARSGYSGKDAARQVLDVHGLQTVAIEQISGNLTDHYDPRSRVLRLSPNVYQGNSLAAVGVACHEAGHAVQHAHNYFPLEIRSLIFPVAQFGSFAAWPLFFLGFLFGFAGLMNLGIIVFSLATLFQIATLPVELDASHRAIAALTENGIIASDEVPGTRKVLNAAALTYVAAALMAIMQLVRLLVLRNMRD